MLRRIFDNIIQHPNDDKYRQIKLTSKTFSSKVWQYPAGEELMKMSGWVVEDDHVTLKDDSCVQILSCLLKQKLKENNIAKSSHTPQECMPNSKSSILAKRPRIHDKSAHERMSTDAGCSTECYNLSEGTDLPIVPIIEAIFTGNGSQLKNFLKQYDTCVKDIRLSFQGKSTPIIGLVYWARQIGIARILVSEYGADANICDDDGVPCFLKLFEGCDPTESCQSLIIQFIKEFKLNLHGRTYHDTALHLAILHKLFSVIKFLVEDCKVDVNYISNASNGGTPLHVAYGIGEKNIAQYLIEHGADQEAIDDDSKKPKDYEFYKNSFYSFAIKYCSKRRVILKNVGPECTYYAELCVEQGISEFEAMDLTFEKFPYLQKFIDGSYVSWRTQVKQDSSGGLVYQKILEATPTLKELNHYITDMAPSYYDIGLQLDIVNSQLKLIKNDPSLPDLKEKCRKMLEVWLENDTSATWKKLCDVLEEEGLSVLAEQIKNSITQ